ncbi:MAG: acyloxyacyl hydrolase [Alphaproteobacteria bacterium]|nr:acyloxyacyl hydrolase [Alphaproteobacteria bacterium]MDP7221828.1 acyloxyacyl hydrolase [Alphaproteobacteria bacterium]
MNVLPRIKHLTSFVCLLGLGLFATTDHADARSSRMYVAGYMGLNLHSQSEFSETTAGISGDYEMENNLTFAGALGLRLTENVRVEGEISYRKSDFDKLDINGTGAVDMSGSMGTWLYMMNLYYDFDTEWRNFKPYITGGVGIAAHDADLVAGAAPAIDSSDTTFDFAYQLGGGVQYELEDGLSLIGDYRYITTSEANVGSYSLNYDSHEFRIGVKYDIPVETIKRFER